MASWRKRGHLSCAPFRGASALISRRARVPSSESAATKGNAARDSAGGLQRTQTSPWALPPQLRRRSTSTARVSLTETRRFWVRRRRRHAPNVCVQHLTVACVTPRSTAAASRDPLTSAFDLGAPVALPAEAQGADDAAGDAAASLVPALAARLSHAAGEPPGEPPGAEDASVAVWALVFGQLRDEAEALGVPRHALLQPATAAGMRAAATLLGNIIASRLSSNL